MRLATVTALFLASALTAGAHAESAVNEAPAQLLAMNQIVVTELAAANTQLPVVEEMVVSAEAEKIDVVDLAMDKVSAQLERQLAERLARDLASQP